MIEQYENLANAIVVQAVKDYRDQLRRWKKGRNSARSGERAMAQNAKFAMESIEYFFRSEWFGRLTTLDPEVLIELLWKES